jgi:hypothetical protein
MEINQITEKIIKYAIKLRGSVCNLTYYKTELHREGFNP